MSHFQKKKSQKKFLFSFDFSRVILKIKKWANKKRELVWWNFPTKRSTDSAIGPPSKRARISEGSEIASSLNQMNQQNNVLDSIFSGSNDNSNQVSNVDELLERIAKFWSFFLISKKYFRRNFLKYLYFSKKLFF